MEDSQAAASFPPPAPWPLQPPPRPPLVTSLSPTHWGRTARGTRPCLLPELLVHGQRDLRRDVNEPLTEQEAHRLGGVVEERVQLFSRALSTGLLTGAQDQLFNLLHTRRTLQSNDKACFPLQAAPRRCASELGLLSCGKGSFPPRPLCPLLQRNCPGLFTGREQWGERVTRTCTHWNGKSRPSRKDKFI